MKTKTSFRDVYSKPGFRAKARFACGIQGDNKARVVRLERRQKKVSALGAGNRVSKLRCETRMLGLVGG